MTAEATYDVVDLEDAADRFRGEGEGADGDQQRLDHQLLQDVGDAALMEKEKKTWFIYNST